MATIIFLITGGLLAQAQTPLMNGALQSGSITQAGQTDSWIFSANAGDGIMLRVGATNLTPKIQLYGPNNVLIGTSPAAAGGVRDSVLSAQATASGTYTVLVSAAFANQSGGYGLTLAQAPEAFVVSPGDQGGALTNGVLNGGAIELGDLDLWRFSANAGDSLMVRMGATNLTPWIRLYGPNGLLVGEAVAGAGGTRDDVLSLVATNSGDYTVVVSAKYAGQFGGYGLTLGQAPGSFVVSPGDQGGVLTNGVLNGGNIERGDLDLWHFNASAGDSLILRMGATNLTPWIRLYGPNGLLVGEANAGAGGTRDDLLSLVATNSGDYIVVVGAKYADQLGGYGLTLAQAPGSFVVSPGDQGGVLTNGVLNAGSIERGDLDLWSFSANAGDSLMLRMGTTNLTPWIRLYGPNGLLVGEAAAGAGGSRDDVLKAVATNSGPYTVVVGAKYADQLGGYGLTLAQAPAAFVTTPGDEGGVLTNGLANGGTIDRGDLDVWRFSAEAGNSLMLRMGATNLTPWIRLYGPNGLLVGEADAGAGGTRDDVLSLVATNQGDYTVVVSAKYADQFGDYALTLAQAPGPFVVAPGHSGGPLTNGFTHLGTLGLGDLNLWSFYGTPGDSNVLRVVSTNFTPWIRLYGPDGALVQETTSGAGGTRAGSLSLEITNAGNYTVVLSATYSGQAGPYSFKESRVPPDLIVPDEQAIDELTPLTLSLTAQDPDVPAKPLVFNLVSGPPGMALTLAGATNATLAWPTNEASGPSTNLVIVTVTDTVNGKAFTRTNSFNVIVNEINTPPQLTVPANQMIDELTPLNVTASATDNDLPPNPLTFSLVAPPAGMTIDPATGAISWTPTEAQGPSTNLVTVVVSDSSPLAANTQSLSATNSFTVVVNEINTPPQLTVPATQTIDELTPLQVTASATDADLPANPLTFALLSPPNGMAINPATGAIAWTPTEAQGPSTNTITVVVTDSNPPAANAQHFSVTNSFTVVVNEINTPPQLTVPATQTIDELTPLQVTVSATDTDVPANPLTFSLISPPTGMAINPATGAIAWTPTEAQGPSTNTVTVVVTDSNPAATSGQQSSATNTFTVVVREVNSVPTLDPISDVTVHFGAPFTVQAVAKDSDLPANVLTYTLEQAPAGLSIGANNGTISWTPAENQVGLHALTVRVTDNGSPPLSATASFQVTVAGQGSHLEVALLPSGASRLVQITAIGDAGNNYVLQKSKDLVTWDTLVQFTMTAAPHQYIDPDSSNTVGFYRLKLAQ